MELLGCVRLASRTFCTTLLRKNIAGLKKLQSEYQHGRSTILTARSICTALAKNDFQTESQREKSAMLSSRSICTTPVLNDARSLQKLKQMQLEYQYEDGKLVWEKAGLRDRVLYMTTLILCALGVINVFLVLFDQAKPPSWKTSDGGC